MVLGDAFLIHPAARLPGLEMGMLRSRVPDPGRRRPETRPEGDGLVEMLVATVLAVMGHLHVVAVEFTGIPGEDLVAALDP